MSNQGRSARALGAPAMGTGLAGQDRGAGVLTSGSKRTRAAENPNEPERRQNPNEPRRVRSNPRGWKGRSAILKQWNPNEPERV